jgi:hypothetical protein
VRICSGARILDRALVVADAPEASTGGAAFADWPGAVALRVAALGGRRSGAASGPGPAHIVAGSGVGAVRDLGVRQVMELLHGHDADAIWLLHTDADTTVPPDWAQAHLRYAEAGVCGVAGMAELADIGELAPRRDGATSRSCGPVSMPPTANSTGTSTARTSACAPMPTRPPADSPSTG